MVEYLSPDDKYIVPRKEQDRQEALFALYQSKLKNNLISNTEYEELFNIVHNCVMSQLKKRIAKLKDNGCIRKEYTSEEIEAMSLDGTCSLIKGMKKKRHVRYIIKTADYLAMYQLYNPKKKFSDKVNKKAISIDRLENYIPDSDEMEIDENGNVINKKHYKRF